jgi:hypothetical protein
VTAPRIENAELSVESRTKKLHPVRSNFFDRNRLAFQVVAVLKMPTLAFQLPDAIFHFGQCLTQPVALRLQTAKIEAGLARAG